MSQVQRGDGRKAIGRDIDAAALKCLRAESIYPVHLRSATEAVRGWVKHRLLT